ncbi:MAG: hypothetical protein J0L92_11560 [Deltaproteobacteria bacterium]|nr:hypothetical protein [Deltaproteobacteria bacterium]
MRRIAVSVLLVALFVSLVGFVVHRRIGGHTQPEIVADAESTTDADDETDVEAQTDTDTPTDTVTAAETVEPTPVADPVVPEPIADPVPVAAPEATDEPVTDPVPQPVVDPAPEVVEPARPSVLLDRPLRVIATHWEAATPILLADQGGGLERVGLRQELRVAHTAAEIEEALARGGAEEGGADLAIVPLSTWVASYEHLAALETEAFFVAAWSRGSQAFVASPSLRAADHVPTDVTIASPASAAETLTLALLLSELGADPQRMRFAQPEEPGPSFAAIERESPESTLRSSGRVPWISTADASRLSPWVVLAPRAFVRDHQPVLVAWSEAWLAALTLLSRDVPASARTIAAIEGAPPLIEVLRRLAQIEMVPLSAQAELAGLAGPTAITIESLFRRTWALHRALGLIDGPVPETSPIATGTIATLVRRTPPASTPPVPFRAPTDVRVLASAPLAASPEVALERLAFLAGVFPRSRVRVESRPSRLTQGLSDSAHERFAIDPARLEVVTGHPSAMRVLAAD